MVNELAGIRLFYTLSISLDTRLIERMTFKSWDIIHKCQFVAGGTHLRAVTVPLRTRLIQNMQFCCSNKQIYKSFIASGQSSARQKLIIPCWNRHRGGNIIIPCTSDAHRIHITKLSPATPSVRCRFRNFYEFIVFRGSFVGTFCFIHCVTSLHSGF
jgi:hypothetical protein